MTGKGEELRTTSEWDQVTTDRDICCLTVSVLRFLLPQATNLLHNPSGRRLHGLYGEDDDLSRLTVAGGVADFLNWMPAETGVFGKEYLLGAQARLLHHSACKLLGVHQESVGLSPTFPRR